MGLLGRVLLSEGARMLKSRLASGVTVGAAPTVIQGVGVTHLRYLVRKA